MTIDVFAPIAPAERTALPPPRAFGETNTLTLPPRARRGAASRGVVARLQEAASAADPTLTTRISVVAADASAVTITF
jgi:hypothetical protein